MCLVGSKTGSKTSPRGPESTPKVLCSGLPRGDEPGGVLRGRSVVQPAIFFESDPCPGFPGPTGAPGGPKIVRGRIYPLVLPKVCPFSKGDCLFTCGSDSSAHPVLGCPGYTLPGILYGGRREWGRLGLH
jgi:hypothetical protein